MDPVIEIFERIGIDFERSSKRPLLSQPLKDPVSNEEKVQICLKLIEDQQKSERWPSGITTYQINSFALARACPQYKLLASAGLELTLQQMWPSCALCLQQTGAGEFVRTLRCGHAFHRSCIDRWLQIKASCPLDRQSMLH